MRRGVTARLPHGVVDWLIVAPEQMFAQGEVVANGRNNLRFSLLRMLKSSMQKKPLTLATRFNAFFSTRILIMIIGFLLGVIAMRFIGY